MFFIFMFKLIDKKNDIDMFSCLNELFYLIVIFLSFICKETPFKINYEKLIQKVWYKINKYNGCLTKCANNKLILKIINIK